MNQQEQTLHLPEKLVGRQESLDSLVSLFNQVSRGDGQIVLIPGRSGVGKTSLVHWLQEPVLNQNGWFVEGKFDQYQQNTPYYAVRQFLSQLWHKMTAAHEHELEEFYTLLKKQFGELGSLLIELIPGLQAVYGQDAKAEEVALWEARHRFTSLIRKLLNIGCQPDHPVVIFLDDCQWADSASLELLKSLQPGTKLKYCLVIISYRDNEVPPTHPLSVIIGELKRGTKPPALIEVLNLTLHDVSSLITQALPAGVVDQERLTREVHGLTGGNPFHVKSFLEYLHETGRLSFNTLSGHWDWRFTDDDTPADIVDLFVRRLRTLNQDSQFLVSLAACLGNVFSLQDLCTISNHPVKECLNTLRPVQEKGLIISRTVGEQNKNSPTQEYPEWFAFMHDRVQQAAFQLISARDLSALHLKIGRQLLAELTEEALDLHLFKVLEHVNSSAELITAKAEQKRMVELNMRAAAKAKAATAYGAMLAFNRAAYNFAEKITGNINDFWDEEYTRAIGLSRNLAESEFIEGDWARAECILNDSLAMTRTAVERAETLNIMVVYYTLLARYSEAIAVGRQALAGLGIVLPHDDYEQHRDDEIARCLNFLEDIPIASLRDAPIMTDETMRSATRLLITLGPPCYRTHQRLWGVIVPKVVYLTLQYGLMPQIGYCYTAFGGLLGWVNNDLERAREFGAVAEQIMSTTFDSPPDLSVFYLMVGSSTRHWFKHLRYASQDYLNAYEIGLKSGNLQYAAYAFGHNMYCTFYQGVPMQELLRSTQQSLVFSRTRLNQWAIDLLEGGLTLFTYLAGDSRQNGAGQDDSDYLQRVWGHQNIQVICIYNILKTFILMVMGNNRQAKVLSDETEQLIYTVGTQGLLPWPEHAFCRFLVLTALYRETDAKMQAACYEELNHILKRLETWAKYCPQNYEHKVLLAKAEMQRLTSFPEAAIALYDQAIELAEQNGYPQWQAIANERAYTFWTERKNGNLEQIYWQQAYICYRRWGAEAKLSAMESEFTQRLQAWHSTAGDQTTAQTRASTKTIELFVNKHIDLLRTQSEDKLEAELHLEAARKTDELADATERLRAEVAERKRLERERDQLEGQVRQRHKMEAIGTLAGGIAHEFNNMLAIIIGNLDLIFEDTHQDAAVMESLHEMKTASMRAKDVVQKLQRFARKSPVVKTPIQIKAVVEETLSLLRKTIPASIDVRTISLCDSELILADRTEISQVLINLCNNAVHAIGDSPGRLSITVTPKIQKQQYARRKTDVAPGLYVQIVVEDTGCGIDPQILDRVFDPYFTTKDVDEGLGMGLAVVLGIIKNHDGDITIESELGQGTRVTIVLPVVVSPGSERERSSQETITEKNKKQILVVDDEASIVRMFTRILTRQGYHVTAQTNPEKALALFQADPDRYDLVITDMSMPSLTGMQFSEQIKATRPDIPVILCTGHASLMDQKRLDELGVDEIVMKPLTIREIEEKIQQVLLFRGVEQ